ncbi:hypothetical protein P3L10_022664 [Capsicum annuum]
MVGGTIPYEDMTPVQAAFAVVNKVLEQFESSVAHDGTLNLVQKSICQDHKKGLHYWIQKLGHVHQTASLHQNVSSMPMPKPRFA